MTRLEPTSSIETTVGAERSQSEHIGRAVSAEQRVYILHSQDCVDTGRNLRTCPYSIALDLGIDVPTWQGHEDRPVILAIDDDYFDLIPHPSHVWEPVIEQQDRSQS
ncbi:hypothetical protein [Microbacterium arborescens]